MGFGPSPLDPSRRCRLLGAELQQLVDHAVDSFPKRLVADPAMIDAVLVDGAARARAIARATLDGVKDVLGFVRA